MALGERSKRICTFRGLTQRELGLKLGYEERSTIHLFQLVRNHGKTNHSDDKPVRYYDNDDWPAASSKADYNGKDNKECSCQWRKKTSVL